MEIGPVGHPTWCRVYLPDPREVAEGGHVAGRYYFRGCNDAGIGPVSPPFLSAADAIHAALSVIGPRPDGRPVVPEPRDRLSISDAALAILADPENLW